MLGMRLWTPMPEVDVETLSEYIPVLGSFFGPDRGLAYVLVGNAHGFAAPGLAVCV